MSTTKDSQWLMTECIGEIGLFQMLVTGIGFLSNYSVPPQQVIAVIHCPEEENFTCSNSTMKPCDPDCPSHVFSHEVFEETVVTEFDLVCDYKYYPAMTESIILTGVLLGSVVFGFFSDRCGRKPTVGVAVLIQLLATIAVAFSNSVWLYTALRWISAFATAGVVLVHYCIFIEYSSTKYRPILGYLYSLPAHVGYSSMGLVAYLCRYWRWQQVFVLVWPAVLLMACWFILPEAPLRLLTLGKTDKVVKILERGAKCNRRPTENVRANVEEYLRGTPPQEKNKGGKLVDLFRTKRMRTKTLVMFFDWFTIGMTYYAIAQYMGAITGNIFLNLVCAGIVAQSPAILLGMVIVQKIGRRAVLITGYTATFIPMAISTFIPKDPYWPIAFLGCISQAGAALGFTTIYMYSCELFPTLVRNIGLGGSSMCCRIGAVISPFIISLRHTAIWIPTTILFFVPFTAALLTWIFLPDTKGQPLSNTVEEADQL